MSANVPAHGEIRQLDGRAEPEEQVTEEQVQDPARLARVLVRLLADVAKLRRRWAPRRLDFEGIVTDGSVTPERHRLTHGFGGPVRVWLVDARNPTGAGVPVFAIIDSASDSNTVTVESYMSGTVTLRVEEAG